LKIFHFLVASCFCIPYIVFSYENTIRNSNGRRTKLAY
jgi:hypothetical protein